MYFDSNERTTARRAEWLARLSATLDEAEQTVRRLQGSGQHAARLAELIDRIALARREVDRLQRAPGASPLDPSEARWLTQLSPRFLPPVHDQVP